MPRAHLCFDTVTSTNDVAKQLARRVGPRLFPDGFCVSAETQTAGRGQFNRPWESVSGGIYVSFVYYVYPWRQLQQQTAIPLLVAAQLREGLKARFGVFPDIKPPNDLLVKGKKICGILVEKVTRRHGDFFVVGIGLNLNQTAFSDHVPNATSLALECGHIFNRDKVMTWLMTVL